MKILLKISWEDVLDAWTKKKLKYLRKMLRIFWGKTFTKKMVFIISRSWMVTYHIWSRIVTNNFSTGHLQWSQSIWPSINDNDRRGHKTRCKFWPEVVTHHVEVFVMFCYLDGENGSRSHFMNVELGPGNFSKVRRHTAAVKYKISVPKMLEKKMTTASEQNPVTELSVSF